MLPPIQSLANAAAASDEPEDLIAAQPVENALDEGSAEADFSVRTSEEGAADADGISIEVVEKQGSAPMDGADPAMEASSSRTSSLPELGLERPSANCWPGGACGRCVRERHF